jgi:hypothetical protein
MKRSKFSPLRFSLLFVLAGIFLYSASVQEIHYLFVDHHTELNEHCHNHLHTQQGHVECNLCKIELSSFVKSFHQFDYTEQFFANDLKVYQILDVKLNVEHPAISPRGPPVSA